MKPSTGYLAAGSLAVATLLVLKGADFTWRMHYVTSPKQSTTAVDKPDGIISTTPFQEPVAVPSIDINKSRLTAGLSHPGRFRALPSNTYHLQHAIVRFNKPADCSKKINVAKLVLSTHLATGSIHLQTMVPYNDYALAKQTGAMPNRTTDQAAAMSALALQQQRTGGSAYHATRSGSKAGRHASSTTAMPVFSSIAQADKGADAYSYTTVYNATEMLKEFAATSGNNTDYAIMVNLGVKSGKKRCFLIDLSSNTIIKCGIVAEGKYDANASPQKKYSNSIGSSATSLGIFKIGKRMNEAAYALQGLQESNSNAFKRGLLLQAADDVPNEEIDFPTLKTNGSLSLSASFFKEISAVLNTGTKPVLLWVYDPAAESKPVYQEVQNQ